MSKPYTKHSFVPLPPHSADTVALKSSGCHIGVSGEISLLLLLKIVILLSAWQNVGSCCKLQGVLILSLLLDAPMGEVQQNWLQ